MADGRHLKITVKSPYLCNRLTDFDEIWYNDAYWTLTAHLPLKCRIFENPRWRRPTFEKSQKSRYLRNGLTDLYEIWYADTTWVSQLLRPLMEMASRKIQTYQNKAKNLYTIYFVFDLDGECKSLKQNIIVIKEICSWLPPFCKENLRLFIQPKWQLRKTYYFNHYDVLF